MEESCTVRKVIAAPASLFMNVAASAAALPPDLAKAVADYDSAQVKGDRAEFERLLVDDHALLNSSGEIEKAKRRGVWQVIYTHVSRLPK